MTSSHFPHRGDKVNDKRRIPHANGFVVRVLYDDGPDEVIVSYDNGMVTYDYGDFSSTWTDDYGGAFVLVNDPKATATEDIEELLRLLNL